jgi:hypothetical protein
VVAWFSFLQKGKNQMVAILFLKIFTLDLIRHLNLRTIQMGKTMFDRGLRETF